jgi:hypothetical protein
MFRRTVFKIRKISEEANCIVNFTNPAQWNCVLPTLKKKTQKIFGVFI